MVYVSQGPQENKISVPPLEGMDLNTAKSLLMSYRLRIADIKEVDPEDYPGKEPGTIVKQSPAEGTMVVAGTSVDVMVVAGENEPKSMRIRIPIESDIDEKVYIEAYVGEDEIASKRIIPEETSSWSFRVEGNGRVILEVYIDRELYRVYGVDFIEEKLYDITDDPSEFKTTAGVQSGVHVAGTELSEGIEDIEKEDSEKSEEE